MNSSSKVYTVYSESHLPLYSSFFLPTVSKWHEVISDVQPQHGTGSFHDNKFGIATRRKIEVILSAFDTPSTKDWFVFSDCDITYFRDYEEDMERRISTVDLVAQSDCGGICTGFMAIRKSKTTQRFFSIVLDYMDENLYRCNTGEGFHDQQATNEVMGIIRSRPVYRPEVARPSFSLVRYNEGYGNLDHVLPGVQWNENVDIPLKYVPYMWHANFTVGMDNKMKMLQRVTEKVQSMRREGI